MFKKMEKKEFETRQWYRLPAETTFLNVAKDNYRYLADCF